MKKNNAFIGFLLITVTFNTYSMETQPIIEQEQPTFSDYIDYIGNILLGNVQFRQEENLPFKYLPPEDQNKIIGFLLIHDTTNSLETIGQIISALTQVNKELYRLINSHNFCLKLIKHLAQRFNCSDETVAIALQIQEATNLLNIQKQLKTIFCQSFFNRVQSNIFYKKYKKVIDLNFTYKYHNDSDFKYTPLMCAAETISNNNEDKIKWLLDTGKVDINCTDAFGITPLMTCALTATPKIITLLCNYPAIQINQQNMHGDTAIMVLCKFCNTTRFNPENMEILLTAGADPEITDNQGISPLERARRNDCEEAIDLLQNAIRKKYEKK